MSKILVSLVALLSAAPALASLKCEDVVNAKLAELGKSAGVNYGTLSLPSADLEKKTETCSSSTFDPDHFELARLVQKTDTDKYSCREALVLSRQQSQYSPVKRLVMGVTVASDRILGYTFAADEPAFKTSLVHHSVRINSSTCEVEEVIVSAGDRKDYDGVVNRAFCQDLVRMKSTLFAVKSPVATTIRGMTTKLCQDYSCNCYDQEHKWEPLQSELRCRFALKRGSPEDTWERFAAKTHGKLPIQLGVKQAYDWAVKVCKTYPALMKGEVAPQSKFTRELQAQPAH